MVNNWLFYIQKLKDNKLLEIKDLEKYIKAFESLFQIRINNNLFSNRIKKNSLIDLFPLTISLSEIFNNGEVCEIISFFKNEKKFASFDLLNEFNEFSKNISFSKELLLIKDDDERVLTFLFLYFSPIKNIKNFMLMELNDLPLVCCSKISYNNFLMIVYLMKEDEDGFVPVLDNNVLMWLFIKDFLNKQSMVFHYDNSFNWDMILPLEKINKFTDEGVFIDGFEEFLSEKDQRIYSGIENEIKIKQKKYLMKNFEKKISFNKEKNKKNLVKI